MSNILGFSGDFSTTKKTKLFKNVRNTAWRAEMGVLVLVYGSIREYHSTNFDEFLDCVSVCLVEAFDVQLQVGLHRQELHD